MTDNLIRRKFQKTDFDANNNKFYDYTYDPASRNLTSQWGRVGDEGQHKNWGYVSQYRFDEMCRKRVEEKGYVEIDLHKIVTSPRDGVSPTIAATDSLIAQVVKWIFEESGEYIKTYLASTVDALSLNQIAQGKAKLMETVNVLVKADNNRVLLPLIQDYYNLIPTQLPRRIDDETLVQGFLGVSLGEYLHGAKPTGIDEQIDRLQQLEAAIGTHQAQTVAPTRTQYDLLGAEIKRIANNDLRFSHLKQMFDATLAGHLQELYEIKIPAERSRFEADPFGKESVIELFHGTRAANVRHILKTGLLLSKASSGGYFGPGLYHSPQARKSWDYTHSYHVPKMMFVNLVAAGKQYQARPMRFTSAPDGYHSVTGQGAGNGDEIIVYKESQVTIVALAILR